MADGAKHFAATVTDLGGGFGQLTLIPAAERVEGHVHERDFVIAGAPQARVLLVGDPDLNNNPSSDVATGTKGVTLGSVNASRMLIKQIAATDISETPEGYVIDSFLNQQRAQTTPAIGKLDQLLVGNVGWNQNAAGWTWLSGTTYATNDVVTQVVSTIVYTYVCTSATTHVAGASTQPGIGGSWTSEWDIVTDEFLIRPGANMTMTRVDDADPPYMLLNSTADTAGSGTVTTGATGTAGDADIWNPTDSTATTLHMRTLHNGTYVTAVEAGDGITLDVTAAVSNHITDVSVDHTLLHAQDGDAGLAGVTAADLVTHITGVEGNAVIHSKQTYLVEKMNWPSPATGERRFLFNTGDNAITISKVLAKVIGTGSPAVPLKLYWHATDTSTEDTPNATWATEQTITPTTPPTLTQDITSFSIATIPADSMVWLRLGTVVDTVDELYMEIRYTEQ